MNHILYITSSSIATNPRLIKNYIYFSSKGYKCTVVAFKYGDWTDVVSQSLIDNYRINCILIPAFRKDFSTWLVGFLMGKLSKIIYCFSKNTYWTSIASSKRAFQLLKVLKELEGNFDFIEAHTLPALFPAKLYSEKKGVHFSFDVEDFHPEEHIKKNRNIEKQRRYNLLKNLLPKAKFITTASPLITREIEKLLNYQSGQVTTINNSFYFNEFLFKEINEEADQPIKFVWFSQTISFGRGLEFFIEAATKFSQQVQLTLIGNLDPNFYEEFIKTNESFISILKPMLQSDLHKYLANFDIGLAIENSTSDFNRDICLTNKLFAYIQSGLFIFATDTSGQVDFLRDLSNLSMLTKQDVNSFENTIHQIILNIVKIRSEKIQRFNFAKKYSYNEEVKKLESLFLK